MIYSHNVSLAEWASVYEAYYTNALRACHGKPTVVVQHADLVADPYKAVTKLHKDLTAAGVAGLALPEEAKVARLPAAKPEPARWLVAPRKSDEAFATLLTTDNADYLRGALVLGSSIRTFDSSRDMIAMVTDKVPAEWHASLTVAGWTV